MQTFGQIISDLQTRTQEDSSTWKTFFQDTVNETEGLVLAVETWSFLEDTQSITTAADTGSYELKADTKDVLAVRIGSGDLINPQPVEDPDFWERLQSMETGSSDTTQYYRHVGRKLEIWPDYSAAGDTITVRYTKRHVQLTQDDYTTGNVTDVTNGSDSVTGSGTSWSGNVYAGQFLQIGRPDGDGYWYEIESVDSSTGLTLVKDYVGSSISGGSVSYTIGDMPLIPGDYQAILKHRTLATYYDAIGQESKAISYWRKYDGGKEAGLLSAASPTGGLLGIMLAHEVDMDDSPYGEPPIRNFRKDINFPPEDLTGF